MTIAWSVWWEGENEYLEFGISLMYKFQTPNSKSEIPFFAHVAQSVEHLHGKQAVTSSNLVVGFFFDYQH